MTEINSTIPSQFLNISNTSEIPTLDSLNDELQTVDVVMILSTLIASVGNVANFTVISVFLNDKKLRKKIPNIFIIHQVSFIFTLFNFVSGNVYPGFQMAGGFPCLYASPLVCNGFLRFTSGATPADLLMASIVTSHLLESFPKWNRNSLNSENLINHTEE